MSNTHSAVTNEPSILSVTARVANSIANGIVHFFIAFQYSVIAAREFERLTAMGNDELAKNGLKRDAIAKHIAQKHLTF